MSRSIVALGPRSGLVNNDRPVTETFKSLPRIFVTADELGGNDDVRFAATWSESWA